ncbi:MAG: hypothetical protein E7390_03265 [Ruminococcaceae bacterium]|nr:hypothetical protein [Oscillospiraceae bacterium]
MYKQYWNDYEKRAEQIRKAARAVESGAAPSSPPSPRQGTLVKEEKKAYSPQRQVGLSTFLERFTEDDVLLLALLFLLITCEEKDITMIIILGYLLLSGF